MGQALGARGKSKMVICFFTELAALARFVINGAPSSTLCLHCQGPAGEEIAHVARRIKFSQGLQLEAND